MIAGAMTNLAGQSRRRRRLNQPPKSGAISVESELRDPTISPQDFYQEMVERPDVRRILTRLAQVEGDGS
jgi:hypothetical protein